VSIRRCAAQGFGRPQNFVQQAQAETHTSRIGCALNVVGNAARADRRRGMNEEGCPFCGSHDLGIGRGTEDREFGLDANVSRKILTYWMETFGKDDR